MTPDKRWRSAARATVNAALPTGSQRRVALARWRQGRKPPDPRLLALAERHVPLTAARREAVTAGLVEHYFSSWATFPEGPDPERYFATDVGSDDLRAHVDGRLGQARDTFIPWLDSLITLDGGTVLEIGCGTGSSTVALAEQGASVVGVDIDADSIEAGRTRLAAYGLKAQFLLGNAVDLADIVNLATFSCVVFYASVEHMTLDERLTSLTRTWEGMRADAVLVVTDTPNRLWWYDHHTSLDPYYLWLPEDLAMRYASRTPRARFRDAFPDDRDEREARLALSRWGRGVSFHDFALALGVSRDELPLAGGMQQFLRAHHPTRALPMSELDLLFERTLAAVTPDVDAAWLLPNLDLALRKP